MNYTVIMAGGRGERFWPLSNAKRPKQLLALTSEKNMLQVTLDRISPYIPVERTLIVAGDEIRDAILEHCNSNLSGDNILCEPFGRNTCLAIGYAAVHLRKKDPDGVMVVLSADHLIQPATKLLSVIKAGTHIASEEDKLITIGIVPTRAETGYGYIEMGEDQWEVDGINVCNVKDFKEKPRPTVAQQYYYGRRHLWNSGMFIWSVESILKAFRKYMPEMHEQLMEYERKIGTAGEREACAKLYEEAEPVSIDVAILEQAENVITLRGDFIWDDVGSWMSLQRFKETDRDNNVIFGSAITKETYESTIYNNSSGIIAAIGVSDLVIVKTDDVVMVAHKTALDKIKDVLGELKADKDLEKYL